jgi:hypothetical protein
VLNKKSLTIPQGGNHNPHIGEEQTTQWPKEKVQKDKQRSTKHTHHTGVNSGAPEGEAVPAALLAPVVLI